MSEHLVDGFGEGHPLAAPVLDGECDQVSHARTVPRCVGMASSRGNERAGTCRSAPFERSPPVLSDHRLTRVEWSRGGHHRDCQVDDLSPAFHLGMIATCRCSSKATSVTRSGHVVPLRMSYSVERAIPVASAVADFDSSASADASRREISAAHHVAPGASGRIAPVGQRPDSTYAAGPPRRARRPRFVTVPLPVSMSVAQWSDHIR